MKLMHREQTKQQIMQKLPQESPKNRRQAKLYFKKENAGAESFFCTGSFQNNRPAVEQNRFVYLLRGRRFAGFTVPPFAPDLADGPKFRAEAPFLLSCCESVLPRDGVPSYERPRWPACLSKPAE